MNQAREKTENFPLEFCPECAPLFEALGVETNLDTPDGFKIWVARPLEWLWTYLPVLPSMKMCRTKALEEHLKPIWLREHYDSDEARGRGGRDKEFQAWLKQHGHRIKSDGPPEFPIAWTGSLIVACDIVRDWCEHLVFDTTPCERLAHIDRFPFHREDQADADFMAAIALVRNAAAYMDSITRKPRVGVVREVLSILLDRQLEPNAIRYQIRRGQDY